jgi:hypothetical protein
MANQTLTQLPIATSASTGDVFYIVTNYQSGSPTLTGESKQIYFSAISSSFTGITISNNVNNGVITATGTTPKLRSESNLTFDGSNLNVTGNTITSGVGNFGSFQVGSQATGGTATGLIVPVYIFATKTSAQSFGPSSTNSVTSWTTQYSNVSSSVWNSTTGIFTPPRTATYRITFSMAFNSFSANTGGEFSLTYGSNSGSPVEIISTTNTYSRQLTFFGIAPLTSGSATSFAVGNITSATLSSRTAAGFNMLLIEEIPTIITD